MSKIDSESENIKEIRAARQSLWADYGNDVHGICDSMRHKEAELKMQGIKFVDSNPKLPSDFYDRLKALNKETNLSAA